MSLKRNGKDTVFSSYFNIKENVLKAVNALFKDTHYDIDDIKVNTLDPTIVNGRYNDLSIQVKDQYVVLVEAQSKWTINILIRCLI